eukprot:TRINITY_DN18008_c0_g1_i1.p1 TRINITY_DN18008_c0_g1~~TRINITY_DN18008_c0_g1_i1.p1  ORF type:complete len:219 (+),score=15.40 TRINITY_DN18008_c0_g1_i1:333-989(+)
MQNQLNVESLDEINVFLTSVLGPSGNSWWEDWKFWTGLLSFLGGIPLFYVQDTETQNVFNLACLVFLLATNFAILAIVQHVHRQSASSALWALSSIQILINLILDTNLEKRSAPTSFSASSMYSNFAKSSSEIAFVAISQIVLIGFYSLQACRVSFEQFNFVYWFVTMFTVQIWMISSLPPQMGSMYHAGNEAWDALFQWHSCTLSFENRERKVFVTR